MRANVVMAFCLFLILGIYLLIRNISVYKFEILLNTRCYEICQNHLKSLDKRTPETMEEQQELVKVWNSIMAIPYEKFLFSFKPLKPEYWLTEKQLAFLRINEF